MSKQSVLRSWGLYNRPEVAAVPSGLSPTPIKKRKMFRHKFQNVTVSNYKVLCYVKPLLGNDCEISRHPTAVAR
jgi:hypothetical protein